MTQCQARRLQLGVGLICMYALSLVCFAETETVETVDVAPGVSQKYSLLLNDAPAAVERAWVLFTGYDGYAHMGLLDNTPVFIGRGILVDGRGIFLRKGSAVAVVDSPSRTPEMSVADRTSEDYLAGTEKVIQAIQAKLPSAKVYLVGASNGSVSVIKLAARMKDRIAGVAVLSGVFTDPAQLKDVAPNERVVFIRHEKDACLPLSFTPAFVERFHPVMVEDIGVHYASTCGPYSAHHFHGQEAAVVELLYQWADAQPLPARLR